MPEKTVECYFEVKRQDIGFTPCLLPGPNRILVTCETLPQNTNFAYLIYDHVPGTKHPETIEEALGMCDAALT